MSKRTRPMSYSRKKRLCVNRIVRLCKAVARRDVPTDLVMIIEDHIIKMLPAPLMRRLVSGDYGRPMREAMKLTIPFFASA